jgi:Gluconate 2-dehydrogenase subunit 3
MSANFGEDAGDDREGKPDLSAADAGLSRREWLLNLGSTIALAGFHGVASFTQEFSVAPLPPGLFQPSLDHLNHALASEGLFFPAPAGSQTEYSRPRSGPFVPQALSAEEFRLVRRLVEILLGDDVAKVTEQGLSSADPPIYEEVAEWIDVVVASAAGTRAAAQRLTPEHRSLAIAYFGDVARVRQLESFEPEQICKEGFAWFSQESRRHYEEDFLATEPSAQIELVRLVSDVVEDRSAINPGTRLYDFLKAECTRGFYTSRTGLKELGYAGNSFYGKPPGCELSSHPVDFSDNSRD